MGSRLMPESVTLNDLERRNGHVCVISRNSIVFGACYIKVVEDRPILSMSEM